MARLVGAAMMTNENHAAVNPPPAETMIHAMTTTVQLDIASTMSGLIGARMARNAPEFWMVNAQNGWASIITGRVRTAMSTTTGSVVKT